MIRFVDLRGPGPEDLRRADLPLDGAQHELRHRPVRPLPARARRSSARTARCSPTTRSSPTCTWRTSDADAQAQAGRLQVRLVRRLPALAARRRGRAAGRGRARSRSPTSWRPAPRRSPGRTTSAWSRARSPPPTTPSGSADPQAVPVPGHDRRLRHGRRHPGPAELGRRRRVHRARSTPRPNTSSTLATSTPIRDHVWSTSSCAAARSTSAQLLEVLTALLLGRRPRIRATASASNASGAAPCAWPWPRASPAWAR